MRLLLFEIAISCVYVFDASTSPFLHIQLTYLTLLYLASMVEILGVFRFLRYLRRRLSKTALPGVRPRSVDAAYPSFQTIGRQLPLRMIL